MYQEFYGLRDLPFELTPSPEFLFMTPQHREALSNLQHGVQARKTLTLLIGDAGTGKTTLIRTLLNGIESAGAYFVYINNPRLTRAEFVEVLARGFSLSREATGSKAALLQEFEEALKAETFEGRLTALVVDEAQSLSAELLEEIRLLANIETESLKLLPVILAGQPELADRLSQPEFRQLKQRVALRCDLRPLPLNETVAYIHARIRMAGGSSGRLFTREAVTLIHERSGGIPRVINTLCDNALIRGFADAVRPVTRALVEDVCQDFDLPEGMAAARAPRSESSLEPPVASDHTPPGTRSRFEMPDWVGRHSADDFNWDTPSPQLTGASVSAASGGPSPKAGRSRRFGLF